MARAKANRRTSPRRSPPAEGCSQAARSPTVARMGEPGVVVASFGHTRITPRFAFRRALLHYGVIVVESSPTAGTVTDLTGLPVTNPPDEGCVLT